MRKVTLALAIICSGLLFHVTSAMSANYTCQYPYRPLVNGQCDNTDPAVPECAVKDVDEASCSAEASAPVQTPTPATPTTPAQPAKRCSE